MKISSLLVASAAVVLMSSAALAQGGNGNRSNSDSNSNAVAVINNGGSGYSYSRTKGRLDTTASGIAPGLTAAGVHSCAGSASLGVGATGFNFGFGSTYEMVECNRRAYAATLAGMGQNAAALALICNNGEVMAALNQTGVICPQQRAVARAGAVVTAYASAKGAPAAAATRAAPASSSLPPFCKDPRSYNPSLCNAQ